MTTDTQVFMKDVKKIFPGVTKKIVFRHLPSSNFTYELGRVGIGNTPKKYHKTIRRINKHARCYTKGKGFRMG